MKKIKIYPRQARDGKKAKMLEKLLNQEFKKYEYIVSAITVAREYIYNCYMIKTPDSIWNRIMEAVVRFDIENMKS